MTNVTTLIDAKFSIVSTRRGHDLLLRNGSKYTAARRTASGYIQWRCVQRNICKANIITNGSQVVRDDPHTCQPNEIDNEIIKHIQKCIDRVKIETTPILAIYTEVVNEYNSKQLNLIKEMPKFSSVKHKLYNQRKYYMKNYVSTENFVATSSK